MCEIPELKPFELYIGTDEAKNAVVYPLDQLPAGRFSVLHVVHLSSIVALSGQTGRSGRWSAE